MGIGWGMGMQQATLSEANLQGVDLEGAKFDEDTILPDDIKWSEDIDLHKFTKPDHLEFWEPDWIDNE